MKFIKVISWGLLVFSHGILAGQTGIRLGLQTGGTVEWKVPALQQILAAKPVGFSLEIQPIANAQAGKAALLAGDVDVIVTDWLWVPDMRKQV